METQDAGDNGNLEGLKQGLGSGETGKRVKSDLCDEVDFKNTVSEYENRINTLGNIVNICCSSGMYKNLSVEEKVKFDLFLSYSLTSLYWVYLRTQGEDPVTHIKSELDRVKKYMAKSKQIHDRKSMPRLDQNAAKRLIRSGLWEAEKSTEATFSKKRKHTIIDDSE